MTNMMMNGVVAINGGVGVMEIRQPLPQTVESVAQPVENLTVNAHISLRELKNTVAAVIEKKLPKYAQLMEKAIEVLNEVKESIINAYASKSGLSHARIANLMSNETWMNAKKAVELGFADEILFSKKEDEPDSDPANPDKSEKTPDEEPGEGEEKKPFQQDTAGHLFSSRQMDLIVLNRLGVKPDTPAAQTEPPSDLPAEAGPVLDMDGKTEEGDYSYNVLMKQLECMK